MARNRKDEEYLEETEPVGVVVLNNVVNIADDVGEIMLDLAKLQRKRSNDFNAFLATLAEAQKGGPESLVKLLPEDVAKQVMGSVMSIMMVAGSLKKGDSGGMPIDPKKMTPEELEKIGKTLKEEAAKLEKTVADYEKMLLSMKGKK